MLSDQAAPLKLVLEQVQQQRFLGFVGDPEQIGGNARPLTRLPIAGKILA